MKLPELDYDDIVFGTVILLCLILIVCMIGIIKFKKTPKDCLGHYEKKTSYAYTMVGKVIVPIPMNTKEWVCDK